MTGDPGRPRDSGRRPLGRAGWAFALACALVVHAAMLREIWTHSTSALPGSPLSITEIELAPADASVGGAALGARSDVAPPPDPDQQDISAAETRESVVDPTAAEARSPSEPAPAPDPTIVTDAQATLDREAPSPPERSEPAPTVIGTPVVTAPVVAAASPASRPIARRPVVAPRRTVRRTEPELAPDTEAGRERQPSRRSSGAGGVSSDATPAGQPGSSASGNSAASRSAWQAALVAHIRRSVRSQQDVTGSVSVRFSVDRAGRVLSANLAGPAGQPLLDGEAIAVFRRAQPLPSPPPDVPGGTFSFTVPIRFTR